MRRAFAIALLLVLLVACGGRYNDTSGCDGVDTSQAPFRRQVIHFPDGHWSETLYWTDTCYITYYY